MPVSTQQSWLVQHCTFWSKQQLVIYAYEKLMVMCAYAQSSNPIGSFALSCTCCYLGDVLADSDDPLNVLLRSTLVAIMYLGAQVG